MAKKTATKVAKKKNTPDNSVAEIYVMIGGMGHSIQAWRWAGLKHQYIFAWDEVLRRHIIKFDSVEAYEAVREDIIHNAGGMMLGTQGFQVLIVTPAMKEDLEERRDSRRRATSAARSAQIQAAAEATKAIKTASNALDDVRKKIGAAPDQVSQTNKLKLKATSLK